MGTVAQDCRNSGVGNMKLMLVVLLAGVGWATPPGYYNHYKTNKPYSTYRSSRSRSYYSTTYQPYYRTTTYSYSDYDYNDYEYRSYSSNYSAPSITTRYIVWPIESAVKWASYSVDLVIFRPIERAASWVYSIFRTRPSYEHYGSYGGYDSSEYGYYQAHSTRKSYWDTFVSTLEDWTPSQVHNLVNSTLEEGSQLADRFSRRFESIIENTTQVHIAKLERLGDSTIYQLEQILGNLTDIADSGDISNQMRMYNEDQIEKIKSNLKELEREAEDDLADARGRNKIEESLQKIVKDMKAVVSQDNLDSLWAKVDKAKLQSYRATEVLTKSVNSLSDIVSSFFTNVKEIEARFFPEEI